MTLILICSFFLPVPVTETLVNWWVLNAEVLNITALVS